MMFDHPANQIDQAGYQQPITFRSGSRQVSMSVEEMSLYFLAGDPIPYIVLFPIDPWSVSPPYSIVQYSIALLFHMGKYSLWNTKFLFIYKLFENMMITKNEPFSVTLTYTKFWKIVW